MISWQKYEKHSDLKKSYGATKKAQGWEIVLWHPFAKNVDIIIFDKANHNLKIKTIKGKFIKPNWVWNLTKDYDKHFYQFKIKQANNKITYALDPYAKSMAPFDWEGKNKNVGKAAFVDIKKVKILNQLNPLNQPQPIIYEAHVRDLTSLKPLNNSGGFNDLIKANIGQYLNKIGFTHIQLLPIHSCYALNENNQTILHKGSGNGWTTNYNWGYDPHNYFSINGWFSSNPSDPYNRIQEFRAVIKHFHKNNIKVILDVVYNHLFHNSILNNIIPNYYFRTGSKVKPVDQNPLATERKMVRKLIIDSLKYFVEYYNIDGFRFDLSTFIDKKTLILIAKKLRKIKPHIVLHGEAWNFTDLKPNESFNKGYVDNEVDFAYFNDTTRNAIKGEEAGKNFKKGLIFGETTKFGEYLASIVANNPKHSFKTKEIANSPYHLFTTSPNVVLNYVSCHDGLTLWDKINLFTKGDKIFKIEKYRQALMMTLLLPGRILMLQGTELLYTKPNDHSGQDFEKSHFSKLALDWFNLGKEFHKNSYRTTDYVNGIRWENLEDKVINKNVVSFLTNLINFRKQTSFFNTNKIKNINRWLNFNFVSKVKGIIDFQIKDKSKQLRIIHNFKNNPYDYQSQGKIIFDSKIKLENKIGFLKGNSTVVIKESYSKKSFSLASKSWCLSNTKK